MLMAGGGIEHRAVDNVHSLSLSFCLSISLSLLQSVSRHVGK